MRLWLLTVASAHSVQGYIDNFNQKDITTTTLDLTDLAGRVRTEVVSSSGNFTFLGVDNGKYELRLVSSTLDDPSIYSIVVDERGVETQRRPLGVDTDSHLVEAVGYPIKLGASRGPEYKTPPKPRLFDLYTDTTVLVAFGALLLLNILPQVWQNMSAEDLKILEGQEGLASAFETAHKIASGGAGAGAGTSGASLKK